MDMKKDHCVGLLYGLYSSLPINIYLRNVKRVIQKLHEIDIERFEDGQLYRNVREPIEFIDDLNIYGKWFNYCPWCGEKINLEEIKEFVNEQ